MASGTAFGSSKGSSTSQPLNTKSQRKAMDYLVNTFLPYALQGNSVYNKKGTLTGFNATGGLQSPQIYTGQQYLPGTNSGMTAQSPTGARTLASTGAAAQGGLGVGGGVGQQPAPGMSISDILPYYMAQQDPQYLQAGNQALQSLSGGMEDVFAPIYQQASNLWNQQIMPGTMERFAGMGNAMSGGAESALAREGSNLSTNLGAMLAPMWLRNQQALPDLAQQMGSWQQGLAQQPLDVSRQIWGSAQPYSNPYLQLLTGATPQGNAYGVGQDQIGKGTGMEGLKMFSEALFGMAMGG